jgi:uncharacterized C2H2 Zn-finger protein
MPQSQVTLGPGQSQEVSFTFIPAVAKNYNVAINGLTGSFACAPSERLAINGMGDLDNDGYVSNADIEIVKKFYMGYRIPDISPLSVWEFVRRADLNRDANIDTGDITAMKRFIAYGTLPDPVIVGRVSDGRGDLNNDGIVDAVDIILCTLLASEVYTPAEVSPLSETEVMQRGDINQDGYINDTDTTLIIDFINTGSWPGGGGGYSDTGIHSVSLIIDGQSVSPFGGTVPFGLSMSFHVDASLAKDAPHAGTLTLNIAVTKPDGTILAFTSNKSANPGDGVPFDVGVGVANASVHWTATITLQSSVQGTPGMVYVPAYWDVIAPILFTCPYCGATFGSQAELDAHIESAHATGNPIFECAFCGATFNTWAERDSHIAALHPVDSSVTCPFCGAVLSNQMERDNHVKTVHPTVVWYSGYVHTASWAYIADARVLHIESGKYTLSNASGYWELFHLPLGAGTLEASKAGYTTQAFPLTIATGVHYMGFTI